MASQTIPYVTPQEYLEAERKAEFKSEYCDGRIYAMAGGRPRHNLIATNVAGWLLAGLFGGTCRVFNSDQRVYIPATGLYTYPDASVACGEPEFFETDNLVNPIVIVEVLSKSTEKHDRTTKFLEYQSIPSLKEYVMISEDPRHVMVCTRIGGNEWRVSTVTEGAIRLESIALELSFDKIFAGVDSLPA